MMAEVVIEPTTAQVKPPSKKKSRNTGPSVGEQIVKAVSAHKRRKGMSLHILKKTLAASGYDVTNNHGRFRLVIKSLLTKGTLVRSKGGTGLAGSFKLSNKLRWGKNKINTEKAVALKPKKVKKPAKTLKTKTTTDRNASHPLSSQGMNRLSVPSSVLSSGSCNLVELELSHNKMYDSGVESLCTTLKHPECKLDILRLSDCSLSDESCLVLSSVLCSGSCNLMELEMSQNELYDSGVKFLCDALKQPGCKLKILRLSDCSLSGESCSVLSSVLSSGSCSLIELELSNNKLYDPGVKSLCTALKQPECKLKILRLSNCALSGDSCSVLSVALRSGSCSLIELELSHNKLYDAGVKSLCDALKQPECKLKILRTEACEITCEGCLALAEALSSSVQPSSNLGELCPTYSGSGESSIKQLKEIKEDPDCKTENLDLY